MKSLEWTEASLDDLAALDKLTSRRLKLAVERFATTETGLVKSSTG